MPSPFPGMDPYLEEPNMWPDVHGMLMPLIRLAIVRLLPDRYTTLLDRYIWLHERDNMPPRPFSRPDLGILDDASGSASPATMTSVAAPITTLLPIEEEDGPIFLRILDRHDRHVVTVVELISPANKHAGAQREEYLTKRRNYLRSGTNLVEIDLLRAGQRPPLGTPAPNPSDYNILVSWAHAYPRLGLWPLSVRDPLPRVPIPLAPPDTDLMLDLKACLETVYDGSGYAREIDYTQPPDPPLTEPDATWARELLARRG